MNSKPRHEFQTMTRNQAFNYRGYRIGWLTNQKLLYHYQHAKMIQSICSIHQIIREVHLIQGSYDNKVSPIFDNANPIIIKLTFSFRKFVSACKKSAHFIN